MKNKISLFDGLSIPVIAAPLFLISGPKLVIECCKNGIVGTFPALNQRTSEGFEEWLIQIKSELDEFEKETGKKPAPFGVNLIVHNTNPRVRADLKICIKHKVPIVITSLGAVSRLVDAVHSYGGLVFHDIVKKRHAEKATEAGVDGLILVVFKSIIPYFFGLVLNSTTTSALPLITKDLPLLSLSIVDSINPLSSDIMRPSGKAFDINFTD